MYQKEGEEREKKAAGGETGATELSWEIQKLASLKNSYQRKTGKSAKPRGENCVVTRQEALGLLRPDTE